MQSGGFLSQHHMLGHTNGFDERFMIQRGKKSCPVKPKLSLKPFSSSPSLLPSSSSSSSSSSPSLQSVWKNKKSSAVHLAAVLGGNTPSYSSASQAPVDNPFSHPPTPVPALPSSSTTTPHWPRSLSQDREVGSGVSAPERPLSLEHVGDQQQCCSEGSVSLFGILTVACNISNASQVLAARSKAGTEKCSSFLTKSKNKNSSDTMKVFTS